MAQVRRSINLHSLQSMPAVNKRVLGKLRAVERFRELGELRSKGMQFASESPESDNAKTGNGLSLTDLTDVLPCLEGKVSFAVLVPVATFIDHHRQAKLIGKRREKRLKSCS